MYLNFSLSWVCFILIYRFEHVYINSRTGACFILITLLDIYIYNQLSTNRLVILLFQLCQHFKLPLRGWRCISPNRFHIVILFVLITILCLLNVTLLLILPVLQILEIYNCLHLLLPQHYILQGTMTPCFWEVGLA